MSRSNILFVFTGSIAVYKACDAVSRLVQRGHKVRAVATKAALNFVGAATLEGLTGERVLTDLFEAGAALEHIDLGKWADLMIVCPATANTLNRLAAGLADDFAGALFLARDPSKPFLAAPAMNPAMWSHPATRQSVEKLSGWGVRFVAVGEGRTACGDVGEGRMAEPAEIVAAVEGALAPPDRRLRVLVTSGGTSEPIDGIRSITNQSTGHTGATIAAQLARSGHDVLFLRARGSAPAPSGCRSEEFTTFGDLDAALSRLLPPGDLDAVIHAAAVSDFSVDRVLVGGREAGSGGKIESGTAPVLQLRPNPKLIDQIRARSGNGALKVVAFKLTRGGDAARAVESLLSHSGADAVVHNDLGDRTSPDAFPSVIHFPGGRAPEACPTRADLGAALERFLSEAPAGA
jgi:phosphopantothenoylcysteine decarboxylase/phosphopantothenate--cysteine ligase